MADLSEMLSGILNDPNTGQKLRALLENGNTPLPSVNDDIDPVMLAKLVRVMKQMNNKKDDERTRLLCDLKPYMTGRRTKRIDEAIEMLKLIRVLDMLKDDFGKD